MATIFENLSRQDQRRVNELLEPEPLEIPEDVAETIELVIALSTSQWGVGGGDALARILSSTDKEVAESGPYNVQCLSGRHIFTAPRGSELEQECIKRAEAGYLDALTVTGKECPDCLEEWNRREADYLFWIGPLTD